jgi:hypothetical protein
VQLLKQPRHISLVGLPEQVPENQYVELLKNIRNLLVAHDMMDDESRSKLSTFVEIMMNLDWLVILGHKVIDVHRSRTRGKSHEADQAIDVEMSRKDKAMRRAYGVGSSGSAFSSAPPPPPDYSTMVTWAAFPSS